MAQQHILGTLWRISYIFEYVLFSLIMPQQYCATPTRYTPAVREVFSRHRNFLYLPVANFLLYETFAFAFSCTGKPPPPPPTTPTIPESYKLASLLPPLDLFLFSTELSSLAVFGADLQQLTSRTSLYFALNMPSTLKLYVLRVPASPLSPPPLLYCVHNL